jgi:hypothetical protein
MVRFVTTAERVDAVGSEALVVPSPSLNALQFSASQRLCGE